MPPRHTDRPGGRLALLACALAMLAATAAFADPTPAAEDPWTPSPAKGRISRPADLVFPASVKAAKTRFDQFGAVRCDDCEGGWDYDSWVRNAGGLTGDNVLEKRVASMAVGDTFRWQGKISTGQFTIVGDHPVGGFPCRQVRYALMKDKQTAQRPGLFCFGKLSPYSGTDRWMEVF